VTEGVFVLRHPDEGREDEWFKPDECSFSGS